MKEHDHGTWRRYVHRSCRCPDCIRAHANYQKRLSETLEERIQRGETSRRYVVRPTPVAPGAEFGFGKRRGP